MKKGFTFILVAILLVMALSVIPISTGCSKATTSSATPTGTAPAATTTAAPPPAQVITIRVAGGQQGITDASVPGRAQIKFFKEVEEATDGRVKFSLLAGAAPDPELYDVVAKGAFDVSSNPIMFNSGRFPTLEAMTLPPIGTICRHPSKVANELRKMYPSVDKDFGDVHLLALWTATSAPRHFLHYRQQTLTQAGRF